jgi:Mrp family chromosome partitioning ATPase
MSGLDRAFIKAYKKHQPVSAMGAAHVAHAPVAPRPPVETPVAPSYIIMDPPHAPVAGPHWQAAPSRTKPEHTIDKRTVEKRTPLEVTLATDWAGPAFEVDQFGWTSPITDLVARGGAELDAMAHKILSATRGGSQVVAIGSAEPRAGGTTLLLCLAQRLAAMKLRAALVDADFASPALAERLGMSPPFGWEDIAEHERSICDVLIESIGDGLALLPLRATVAQPERLADDLYWRTTIEALRGRYRLLLLDAGTLSPEADAPAWLRPDCGVDAAIVVGRDSDDGRDALTSAVCHLQECNIDVLGVVENFCQPEAQRLARQRPRVAVGT